MFSICGEVTTQAAAGEHGEHGSMANVPPAWSEELTRSRTGSGGSWYQEAMPLRCLVWGSHRRLPSGSAAPCVMEADSYRTPASCRVPPILARSRSRKSPKASFSVLQPTSRTVSGPSWRASLLISANLSADQLPRSTTVRCTLSGSTGSALARPRAKSSGACQ